MCRLKEEQVQGPRGRNVLIVSVWRRQSKRGASGKSWDQRGPVLLGLAVQRPEVNRGWRENYKKKRCRSVLFLSYTFMPLVFGFRAGEGKLGSSPSPTLWDWRMWINRWGAQNPELCLLVTNSKSWVSGLRQFSWDKGNWMTRAECLNRSFSSIGHQLCNTRQSAWPLWVLDFPIRKCK